jgi:predicted nucleic acid-binding Zn ribbon protein
VQSFSEDTLAKCPTKKSGKGPLSCTAPGRGKVSKVFSAPGITFKGDGFYKNDSREKSKSTTASKPSKSDSDSNGTSSGESTKSEKPTTAAADKGDAKADSKKPAGKKNEKTSS